MFGLTILVVCLIAVAGYLEWKKYSARKAAEALRHADDFARKEGKALAFSTAHARVTALVAEARKNPRVVIRCCDQAEELIKPHPTLQKEFGAVLDQLRLEAT